jgi:hypothetical protein
MENSGVTWETPDTLRFLLGAYKAIYIFVFKEKLVIITRIIKMFVALP